MEQKLFPCLKVHRLGPTIVFSLNSQSESWSSRTYTLVVNNLDNCCQASAERSMGKKDNASNLNEPPLGGFDLDFCHGGDTARIKRLPTGLRAR